MHRRRSVADIEFVPESEVVASRIDFRPALDQRFDSAIVFWTNSRNYGDRVDDAVSHRTCSTAHYLQGDVTIDGRNGVIYIDDRAFSPSVPRRKAMLPGTMQRSRWDIWSRLHHRSIDEGIYLRHPHEHNYYHWLIDVLSRLAYAEQLCIDRSVPLVVSDSAMRIAFVRETLSALARERPIYVQFRRGMLRVRNLYALFPSIWHRPYLGEFGDSISETDPGLGMPERICLLRKTGLRGNRVIEKYDELARCLKTEGYVCIDPATLTVAEQKHLFFNARHVVAEYGASLTNLVFARPDCRIDTLALSTAVSTTFPTLARIYSIEMHVHCINSLFDGKIHRCTVPSEVFEILNSFTSKN